MNVRSLSGAAHGILHTPRRILALAFGLLLSALPAFADYYVGPSALGDGSGSDWNNRAGYTNSSFWSGIQSQLASGPITVRLAGGTYNVDQEPGLDLAGLGHPVNKLSIIANTLHAPVFTGGATTSHIIKLRGSQNLYLYGITFTGGVDSFALWLQSSGRSTSRFIQIDQCDFHDLTSSQYGAIGILDASRDISVTNCTFNNVGNGSGAHMIYSDHDSRNLTVTGCTFTNCRGDYVRFRDDTDFVKVDNCTFHSTSSTYNQDAIRIPLFNDVNPGDEYFGTDFQFTNNTITYDNTSGSNRVGIAFDCNGYNSPGYDFSPTTTQAATLSGTDYAAARSLLSANMGIEALRVHIYGNSFTGTANWEAYGYFANYGSTGSGVNGYTNVRPSVWATSGTLPAAPKLGFNANFQRAGKWLRNWDAMWSGTQPAQVAGLNGTSKAAQLASSGSNAMWQWVTSPLSSTYTTDLLFNVGTPGATGLVFAVDVVHNQKNSARVTVGVNDQGQIVMSNGSDTTLAVLSGLPAIQLSTSVWYHLRITGDYSGATPHVDVSMSDANSTTLTHSVTGLSYWVGGAPATGQSAYQIVYRNNATPATIDELTWQ